LTTIQATIQARAAQLGLTAYALAKLAGMSEETVRPYLQGKRDMTSRKVDKLLEALGLEVKEIKREKK
jgi:transcriptional regulator with XRE-family HTH domain